MAFRLILSPNRVNPDLIEKLEAVVFDKTFADHFASDWIASWNSHDLDRILSPYTDDFDMTSPLIVKVAGEPSGTLKGKETVRAYWHKALELIPPSILNG